MAEWKLTQGSQEVKPAELDTTSSRFYVYQRRNIERVTVGDEFGTAELWQYEERKMTRDEYAQLRIATLAEENTQLQLALTELYESILEG